MLEQAVVDEVAAGFASNAWWVMELRRDQEYNAAQHGLLGYEPVVGAGSCVERGEDGGLRGYSGEESIHQEESFTSSNPSHADKAAGIPNFGHV